MKYKFLKIYNKDNTMVIFAMSNIRIKEEGKFYYFYTIYEDRYVGVCRFEDFGKIEGEKFE